MLYKTQPELNFDEFISQVNLYKGILTKKHYYQRYFVLVPLGKKLAQGVMCYEHTRGIVRFEIINHLGQKDPSECFKVIMKQFKVDILNELGEIFYVR